MPGSEVIDLTSLSDSDAENIERRVETDDSEGAEIEIALSAETRIQLRTAIATISEARLRRLLSRLVETDITIEAALSKELLTSPGRSRNVVPRWEICANCNEEYDTNVQSRNALAAVCVFHPGESSRYNLLKSRPQFWKGDLEILEEAFVDWDEDCHGPMDSNRNRRDYPENFLWSCCEKDGTSDGCVQRKHRPAVPKKRKRSES